MDLYFPQASVMPLPSYFLTSTPFIELVFLFKGPPPFFRSGVSGIDTTLLIYFSPKSRTYR